MIFFLGFTMNFLILERDVLEFIASVSIGPSYPFFFCSAILKNPRMKKS